MKYYLNESSYINLKNHINRYGDNLECVAYHVSKNYVSHNEYYHFDFIGFGDKIVLNIPESYQDMGAHKYWHINSYEINIQYDGRSPEKRGVRANIYDPTYTNMQEKMKRKTPIHMGVEINKTQYLYYTLFI